MLELDVGQLIGFRIPFDLTLNLGKVDAQFLLPSRGVLGEALASRSAIGRVEWAVVQLEFPFGAHCEDAASRGERAALAPSVAVVEDADDEAVLDFHDPPAPLRRGDGGAVATLRADPRLGDGGSLRRGKADSAKRMPRRPG